MSKDVKILYHADCPDGFGAAWAAYKKFKDTAEYIAVTHDNPPPPGLEGKDVYLLDFSYTEEIMRDLIAKARRTTAIDHHVSRESAVKLAQEHSYSVDNSGSVLAWKFFHNEPVPKLLEYIEDRDLYKFSLPDSRATCAFIDTVDFDFKIWDGIVEGMDDKDKKIEYLLKGEAIVEYEAELVKRLVEENSKLVEFEGILTTAVNAPHMLASDIGHVLYMKQPPMAIIWSEDRQRVHISLRSDGTVDVSELAKKYGGGGHKAAAGFSLPSIKDFPWKSKE